MRPRQLKQGYFLLGNFRILQTKAENNNKTCGVQVFSSKLHKNHDVRVLVHLHALPRHEDTWTVVYTWSSLPVLVAVVCGITRDCA